MSIAYGTASARPDLGAALMEYALKQVQYIGKKVFPTAKVDIPTGFYDAVTRESLTLTADARRARSGGYNRVNIATEEKTFACREYGLEAVVFDDVARKLAPSIDDEMVEGSALYNNLLRSQESRIAAKLFNTSTFTGAALYTDLSGSAPWTTAGSDAIGAIKTAAQKIHANCGMLPNTLVVSKRTFDNLTSNTGVIDAIKYTTPLTQEQVASMLAAVLGIENILIGSAVQNGAAEGQAFSSSNLWSNLYASLCIVSADRAMPSIGRTFLWAEDSPDDVVVESYREEKVRGTVLRVRQYVDENLVDPYFGHLLKIATA